MASGDMASGGADMDSGGANMASGGADMASGDMTSGGADMAAGGADMAAYGHGFWRCGHGVRTWGGGRGGGMPSGGVGMVSVGADMASGGANMVSGATMGSGLRTWPLTWLGGADMVSGGADMAGEVPTLQVRTFPLDADMAWRCGHGLWSADMVSGARGTRGSCTGYQGYLRVPTDTAGIPPGYSRDTHGIPLVLCATAFGGLIF
jgi:hypothetical protein